MILSKPEHKYYELLNLLGRTTCVKCVYMITHSTKSVVVMVLNTSILSDNGFIDCLM